LVKYGESFWIELGSKLNSPKEAVEQQPLI